MLPNAISPAVKHKIRLVLVCTAAFKIFVAKYEVRRFVWLYTACLSCHIYVHCVSKNKTVAQVQNVVKLVVCIYDKICGEAMSLC